MRARVEQLGVTQASIRRADTDEIEVVLPEDKSAAAQETMAKAGQLYFYDWEPNVVGASGQPAPTEGTVTGDATSEGPGGVTAGLPEYQALLRATRRPAILRKTDTTLTPGCTSRQAGGCLYGSWYLIATTHEHVLRGPEDTQSDLYADGYKPPAGAKPRAVRVNPGTVLVQAHALEDEKTGAIVNASPNSWYVLNDNPMLTGADLVNPAQSKDEVTGRPDVIFGFTSYGKTVFERVTKEIAHRGQEAQLPGVAKEEALQHFAVVLDGQLITVPSIDYTKYPEGIDASTGSEISGGLTITSAQNLASELQSGALPIRLELISRSRVSTASNAYALDAGGPITRAQAIAYAHMVNLQASDVPRWALVPADQTPSRKLSGEVAVTPTQVKLARCYGGVSPRRRVATVDSPIFQGGSGDQAYRVESEIIVMPTAALAAEDRKATQSARGDACLAQENAFPSQTLKGEIVHVGRATISRLPAPLPGANGSGGFLIARTINRVRAYYDNLGFVSVRAEISLTAFSIYSPIPSAIQHRLLPLLSLLFNRAKTDPL